MVLANCELFNIVAKFWGAIATAAPQPPLPMINTRVMFYISPHTHRPIANRCIYISLFFANCSL